MEGSLFHLGIPHQGGGQVCFWTPHIDRGLFKKRKLAAGEKILGSFFQKFDGFSKNFENLTVFSTSTRKKASFFAPTIFRGLFLFRPRTYVSG